MINAVIAVVLIGGAILFDYARRAPLNEQTPGRLWLPVLPLALAHPTYLLPVWFAVGGLGHADQVETNSTLIHWPVYVGFLAIVGGVRFGIFYGVHRLARGHWHPLDGLAAFARAHALCAIGVPLLGLWGWSAVEGNVGALIYLPVTAFAALLVGVSVLLLQGRTLMNAPKAVMERTPEPSGAEAAPPRPQPPTPEVRKRAREVALMAALLAGMVAWFFAPLPSLIRGVISAELYNAAVGVFGAIGAGFVSYFGLCSNPELLDKLDGKITSAAPDSTDT